MSLSNKRKIACLKDAETAQSSTSTKRRKLMQTNHCQPQHPLYNRDRGNCRSLHFEEWRRKYQRRMNFYDLQKDKFVSDLHKSVQLHGHKGCVNTIDWEQTCGKHLISGSDDQTCRIWDVFSSPTPKTLCVLQGHLSNIFSAKFMYSSSVCGINNICVSGGNDADVHLYDIHRSPSSSSSSSSASSSMFIAPLQSYRQHSRKVLNIAVTQHRPYELYSCSADGTVRHFDMRRKYDGSQHAQHNCASQHDIVIQAFGGGGGQNRGRFSESLLYDFNTCHKHCEVYSIDIHPHRAYELLCACADGNLYVMDTRKHDQGRSWHPIASFTQCHPSNAVAVFHNQRHRFPSSCHPTYCTYNSDGSEILSTHIHDACYVYVNPITAGEHDDAVAVTVRDAHGQLQETQDEQELKHIVQFIKDEDEDETSATCQDTITIDDEDDEDEDEDENVETRLDVDEESFMECFNVAMMTRVASRHRQRRFEEALNANDDASIPNALWSHDSDFDDALDDDEEEEDDEEGEGEDADADGDQDGDAFGGFLALASAAQLGNAVLRDLDLDVDDDIVQFVETLVRRKKELDRHNASDTHMQFQSALIDSLSQIRNIRAPLSNGEWKAIWAAHYQTVDIGAIKRMKWNDGDTINTHHHPQQHHKLKAAKLVPPIDSNADVFTYYDNQHIRFAMQQYEHLEQKQSATAADQHYNLNGMMLGEEPALHKLDEPRSYFGRYVGHIHCDTLKQVAFFSDNYVVTGSDDSCIYIYDRLTGDIVNILDNETDIVNNIAVHPYFPMFVTSGLDSHISLWAPYKNQEEEESKEDTEDHDEDAIKQCLFTQQIVDNVVRLRYRVGVQYL